MRRTLLAISVLLMFGSSIAFAGLIDLQPVGNPDGDPLGVWTYAGPSGLFVTFTYEAIPIGVDINNQNVYDPNDVATLQPGAILGSTYGSLIVSFSMPVTDFYFDYSLFSQTNTVPTAESGDPLVAATDNFGNQVAQFPAVNYEIAGDPGTWYTQDTFRYSTSYSEYYPDGPSLRPFTSLTLAFYPVKTPLDSLTDPQFNFQMTNVGYTPTPEPGTLSLLGIGLAFAAFGRYGMRKRTRG